MFSHFVFNRSRSSLFEFHPLPVPKRFSQQARSWPTKRLVLLAGETSGDHIGAAVVEQLAQLQSQAKVRIEIAGTGGSALASQGMKSLVPIAALSHMGWLPVLANLFGILLSIAKVKRAVAVQEGIDAIIGIDAQAYVEQIFKSVPNNSAIRRVQMVAPTVWGRKPERAAKSAEHLDRMLCIYPFEPPLFERYGLKATFVGHPLVGQKIPGEAGKFRRKQALREQQNLIALLPGSRPAEVQELLPIFARSVQKVSPNLEGVKDSVVAVLVAPIVQREVRQWCDQHLPDAILVESSEDKWDLFKDADVALCCAGTAVIELSLSEVPTVLGYRQDVLSNWIWSKVWRTYASIVNIIAGSMVHPEYVLGACTDENLRQALIAILSDKNYAKALALVQKRHVETLGVYDDSGASVPPARVAAEVILEELGCWPQTLNVADSSDSCETV